MAEKTAEQVPERAALRWIGGALLGLVVGGAALYFLARPDDTKKPEESASAVAPLSSDPATPDEGATDSAAVTQEADANPAVEPDIPADSAEIADQVVPSFDTVRVEADGSVLVAGRAGAGASVAVLVDDAAAATAEADNKGAFASLFTLAPSENPRVMTLVATAPDGSQIASEGSVVIGPVAAPEVVASANPDTAPESPADAPQAGDAIQDDTNETPVGADEVEAPEETELAAETEPEAPEVLIIDSAGVRRQTDAGPVANIVIDTIGYGPTGNVEITGRGTVGHFARVYLDNTETADVRISEGGGWAAVLADVAPGLYTLRVDQLDGAGKVTSRFETPFQREAREDVLAALQPEDPAAGPTDAGAKTDLAASDSPSASAISAPQADQAPKPDEAPEAQGDTAPALPVTGSATGDIAAPTADSTPRPATRAAIVTVQPGYSLWRIARENYGDGLLYVKVFEANQKQIRDPDLIYPGQIFTIPDPAE